MPRCFEIHACRICSEEVCSAASQVGSGVGKEEQEIPLDINYSALSQWAVDRKRVSADWRKRLAALQVRRNMGPASVLLPPLDPDGLAAACV